MNKYTLTSYILDRSYDHKTANVVIPCMTRVWQVLDPSGKPHGAPYTRQRLAENAMQRLNGVRVTYDAYPSAVEPGLMGY